MSWRKNANARSECYSTVEDVKPAFKLSDSTFSFFLYNPLIFPESRLLRVRPGCPEAFKGD